MRFSPSHKLKISLSALTICFILAPTFSFAAGKILIDEFRTRSATDKNDEYIVVANYGTESINLMGYTLHKRTPSATSTPELIHTFGDVLLLAG